MRVDLRWKVPKTNQLWIKWNAVERLGNGTIKLKDVELFGLVLSDCLKLETSGNIKIDLTRHFILLIPTPYIVTLKWDNVVSQTNEKVLLKEIIIEDTALGHLNKLKNSDLLLLDCTDHTTEKMAAGKLKTAFDGMVYKETLEAYDFSEK